MKMRRYIWLLALCFSPLQAQELSKTDKTEEYMQAAVKAWGFTGTVLVSEKGEPFYANGFGKASYQLNVPNDSRNIFRIGALTKTFTAAAIMQQVQKGLIELSHPVGKYLADLPREWSDKVTIQHLLTNTSGLPDYQNDAKFLNSQSKEINYAEFANYLANLQLRFDPGTNFEDSNTNYIILGLILTQMTAIPFEGYIQQRFVEPLALKSTGYFHQEFIVPLMAGPYSFDASYQIINAACPKKTIGDSANGLYSSLSDLFVWTQALLKDRVIGPYMKKLSFAPNKNNYGFGWHVDDAKAKSKDLRLKNYGKTHYWQEGETDGYAALLSVFPDDNVIIIILSNNDQNFHSSRIFYPMHDALSAIVFNQPYPPPVESVLKTPR